eukprot:gene50100-26153_t
MAAAAAAAKGGMQRKEQPSRAKEQPASTNVSMPASYSGEPGTGIVKLLGLP